MYASSATTSLDSLATRITADYDGRLQLICVRPPGSFAAFDAHLTELATRLVRVLHVRILRTWDAPAAIDLGFVSRTVPTVLLVRDGHIVAKCIGDAPAGVLFEGLLGLA